MNTPQRRRLPTTRPSITHKDEVCRQELYVTVGFYDDATGKDPTSLEEACQPAEVFVKVAKHGSEISGLFDGLCVTLSLSLQYGVPWAVLRDKYLHTKFGMGDGEHGSLLDGFAKMVDHVIAVRRTALEGDGPGTVGAPVPAPKPPAPLGSIQAAADSGGIQVADVHVGAIRP